MKFKSVVVGSLLMFGSLSSFAAENRNCEQPFRQMTITTAHTVAGLLCNLHSNNATEKLARTLGNSINFVHKWNVDMTDNDFVINAVCSTAIRYYDNSADRGTIVHPGYLVSVKLPRYEDLCDPSIKGTVTELYKKQTNANSTYSEIVADQLAAKIAAMNTRDVLIRLKDTGSINASTKEYTGSRSLSHLSIGNNLISMLRSGFTGGAMNQGGSSEDNKMAIGDASTMTYGQFFGFEKGVSSVIPDFTRVASTFQFNKATDAALANRDLLSVSGLANRSFYVRQNGSTRAYEDDKLSLKYDGGTSAFYIRSAGKTAASVEVVGCTDYSYSGDQNLAQTMTVNDCHRRIEALTGY